MKRVHILFMAIVMAIFVSSCSPRIEPQEYVTKVEQKEPVKEYGFWMGLWHGWTAPITFIGNLLGGDWIIYAFNNTGGWYDFGFILGIGSFGGGVSSASRKR